MYIYANVRYTAQMKAVPALSRNDSRADGRSPASKTKANAEYPIDTLVKASLSLRLYTYDGCLWWALD